jgi:hypothetical protein
VVALFFQKDVSENRQGPATHNSDYVYHLILIHAWFYTSIAKEDLDIPMGSWNCARTGQFPVPVASPISGPNAWLGLCNIRMVEAEPLVGDQMSRERGYYIMNHLGKDFERAVRSYWGIKNGLHGRSIWRFRKTTVACSRITVSRTVLYCGI